MNKFKSKKIVVTLLILGIMVGFAALTTNLSILGTANVKKQVWDLHWENVNLLKGEELGPVPIINEDRDVVNFQVNLEKPGDIFTFTVDAKNDGTLDAKIIEIKKLIYKSTNKDKEIDKPDYIDYSVTYSDGTPIKENQLIKSKEKETYLITVKYSEDYVADDQDSLTFELSFNYQMYDGTGTVVAKDGASVCSDNKNISVPAGTVCRRAETLHQETCEYTEYTEDDLTEKELNSIEEYYITLEKLLKRKAVENSQSCYKSGYSTNGEKGTSSITYGTCGTQGETPKVGDAFDCDVNGDGNFDEDERFYFISESEDDSNYAIFVYYKNVDEAQYDESSSNKEGPITLIDVLPTTEEWTNTGLNTNMTRQIQNEEEETIGSDFTYTDKAARLLTAKEVETACELNLGDYTVGGLDNCQFLLENTNYAKKTGTPNWWLETPYSDNRVETWYVDGNLRRADHSISNSTYGVRPVIEVDKTKIAY